MRHPIVGAGLACLLSAAALAACGPSQDSDVPPQPTGTPPTTAPTATPTGDPTSTSDPTDPPVPKKSKPSAPISQSKLIAQVRKAGIDLTKPLEKMRLIKKKKLMPFFQEALGFKSCRGCHTGGEKLDYKKETRNMKVARGMWNNFVVKLRDEKNQAIFCDSCHNGTEHVLNREDTEVLQQFMTDEYEGKLNLAGGDISCSTCHTDVFEGKIIEKVWNIPAKH